jgi:hypothetical protein
MREMKVEGSNPPPSASESSFFGVLSLAVSKPLGTEISEKLGSKRGGNALATRRP